MRGSNGGANMGPHTSDSYTSRTMTMARNGEATPNSSPAGVLQKREPRQQTGMGEGNTPNSSPSEGPLQKSSRNLGQRMVTGYHSVPAVSPLGGIPSRDPNPGGAAELSKTTRNFGFSK